MGGTQLFNIYLGYIRIPTLNFVQYGKFMGVHLAAGNQPYRALVGRTVLRDMILVYNGRDGSVNLAV